MLICKTKVRFGNYSHSGAFRSGFWSGFVAVGSGLDPKPRSVRREGWRVLVWAGSSPRWQPVLRAALCHGSGRRCLAVTGGTSWLSPSVAARPPPNLACFHGPHGNGTTAAPGEREGARYLIHQLGLVSHRARVGTRPSLHGSEAPFLRQTLSE